MALAIEKYSAIATQKDIVTQTGRNGIKLPASKDVEYAGGEFGRDTTSAAEGNLLFYPDIARRIILARAADQGVEWNYPDADHPSTEKQPGRIIHEKRLDDISFLRSHFSSQQEFDEFNERNRAKNDRLIRQWGRIYYGSVDATPKYIVLVRDYTLTTRDTSILDRKYKDELGDKRTIFQSVIAAADWVYNNALYGPNVNIYDGQNHQRVDRPLLRFKRLNGLGIQNQVLMDSEESFVFPDGRKANHDFPIADTGSQAKAYDGLLFAAALLEERATSHEEILKATNYRKLAKEIQHNTLQLWQEDQQYFAMGEDVSGAIRTKCLNAAELLNSSIFDDLPEEEKNKYISGITRQIFSPDMYTIVGPRIKDLHHRNALMVRYKGRKRIFDAYHDYSTVWIEMNHEIARGLQRQGLDALARQIKIATIDGINIEGKPTEFFRVTTEGKVLYNQKQHLTEDVNATFNVTSLAEEEQTWTNTAILEFKSEFGARRERAERMRLLPKSDRTPWHERLEQEILQSLMERGIYKDQPMKSMEEIQKVRETAAKEHLTINTKLGEELIQVLRGTWEERKKIRRINPPVGA